jgi:MFS transporter, DHA3 family, macrolide efflux protein
MIKMLLYERQFSTLLGGNLLSKIGDGVHEFVFIVTVLRVTNNGIGDAGVIYFFRFIPYLILGPIGGALSDRLSRKSLMLGADLARMMVTGVFCALLVSDQVDPVLLALLGMLMTAFRTIFQPAFQAIIPVLVRAESLPTANGATQIVGEIGGLIGPAVGGAALALIASPGHVLVLDAATYLLSALCVMVVPIPANHVAQGETAQRLTLSGLYGDFGKNLLGVVAKSQLFVTIAYSSACLLFVGAALRILIPAMMKNAGFSDSLIGYAMSLTALGAIAGAVLCGKVARDFSTRSLMAYWCLYGLMLSLLPACAANATSILAGCFMLGAFGAFVDVVLPTNIQELSTNVNMGKNFSLFSTLANTGEALSGAFAGGLVMVSPIGVSVSVIGILIASVAYVGKLKAGRPE